MLPFTRADGRRVFVLGVAGLVPAAVVTLLLVHQPSIGDRRLYPMLRGPLTVVGLCLALATLIAWTADLSRFSRRNLSGLAWAGLTATLCLGPFLDNAPTARLFALELDTGEVAWSRKRAVAMPALVDGDVVVSDVGSGDVIGLDPATGRERWRVPAAEYGTVPSVGDRCDDWSGALPLLGETAAASARSGDACYAYVVTPGAADRDAGSVVAFGVDDGEVRWRVALPSSVATHGGMPSVGAGGDVVIVAGGERIAALAVSDGRLLWSQSVVALSQSRGYALPGAVQEIIVTDEFVFLLATPQG